MDKLVICLFVALVAWASEAQAKPKAEPDELIAVAVVFRHGDRTIIETYPNDPYLNYSWPVGLGQLTNAGKKRHLDLGKWFRERYATFLPANYSEETVYVRSSDVDRCLMSAAANLAGLYPPQQDQFSQTLNWQPIPIHTYPSDLDNMIANGQSCEQYTKLFNQLLQSEELKKVYEDYKEEFALCKAETGWDFDNLQYFEELHGILQIEEKDFNLQLQNWTSAVYPRITEMLGGLSFALPTYTAEMGKFVVGPFFDDLTKRFERAESEGLGEYQPTHQKFMIYSGHDNTVANILNSMGLYDNVPPPFASTIIFEMKNPAAPYVNVIYKKDSLVEKLTLEGCDTNCPWDQFKKILEPVTIDEDEWAKQCVAARPTPDSGNVFNLSFVSVVVAVVAVVCNL